ncbi:MAG TPA: endonuclease III domain-containing protein [Deltaproteobacteria bacterium]|nr:endonuclease III domain-containing protein [Deltaproteobacteria bacterium]
METDRAATTALRPQRPGGNELPALLRAFYDALFASFGPQHWWPGRTRFEVVVGAILTQNTAWTNVEKAIARLRERRMLTAEALHRATPGEIAGLIRPAGYFNVKAARLKAFTDRLFERHGGSLRRLFRLDDGALRKELLSVKGIGPETADSIMLYAARRAVFVIDAYTKRILTRHGLADHAADYAGLQRLFMDNLPPDTALFNEYHALLVKAGKDFCRPAAPRCGPCPLNPYLEGDGPLLQKSHGR